MSFRTIMYVLHDKLAQIVMSLFLGKTPERLQTEVVVLPVMIAFATPLSPP
jgi:hypothetical protein